MGLVILLLLSAAIIATLTPWRNDDERSVGANALLAAALVGAVFASAIG